MSDYECLIRLRYYSQDFSLSVSPGAVIVISYIGYVTQELKAIAGAPLKVVLKDDSRTLDEVVVTAYKRKRT